jgi:pimeloyl-ACP methyl ester carboxylesterase
VLCVHGALVDGRAWNGVAERLATEATVVLPDLPLGAHRTVVPDRSRLNPPDLAGALVDVLDALDAPAATLVGNDSGGALSQVAVATFPDRFEALVLTACDAFEHFPPPLLWLLPRLIRLPGVSRGVARVFSHPALRSRPGPLNLLAVRPVDQALVRSWMTPVLTDDGVRDDFTAFVRGMNRSHTLEAAEQLAAWPRPAVIAWSRRDRIFPPADGVRLAETLPNAELIWIDDALTFSMLDQPEAVAAAVRRALARVGLDAAQG